MSTLLLTAHDTNSSGSIDTQAEVESIECDTFIWINAVAEAYSGQPFRVSYGVEPQLEFIADLLGFDSSVRVPLQSRLTTCIA